MWSNLLIAVGFAVVLTVALILTPHVSARMFGLRCSNCGCRPVDRFDHHVFYDPAPEWSLFRCTRCGSDFIQLSGRLTARSKWDGDPEAERMFQELESFT